MKKTLDILANVLQTISGILFIFVFAIIVAGIVSRTFLGFSILWVSDVCNISIAWMLAFGMSVAFHKSAHLNIDFLRDKLPPQIKKVLMIVLTSVSIVFLITLIITGWQTTVMKMGVNLTVLNLPTGYVFMAIPVFAFLSTIFMTYRLVNMVRGHLSTE